jgi:hypothetical protein
MRPSILIHDANASHNDVEPDAAPSILLRTLGTMLSTELIFQEKQS